MFGWKCEDTYLYQVNNGCYLIYMEKPLSFYPKDTSVDGIQLKGIWLFYLVCSTDEITLYYWHRISVPTLIVPFFYVCLHCFLYFHTENLSYFLWGSRQFDFTRFLPHEISVSDSLIFIHLSGVFKDSELEARYKKCGLVGQQQKPVGFVCSLLI